MIKSRARKQERKFPKMTFDTLWREFIVKRKYPEFRTQQYTKEELRDYARALVEAAEHIARTRPDLIIAPARGAFPLWKGVQLALMRMRKMDPSLRNYWPYVIVPPNTGKELRGHVGRILGRYFETRDLIEKMDWFTSLEQLRAKIPEIEDDHPKLARLVRYVINEFKPKNIREFKRDFKKLVNINTPRFNKILLIDEVYHGGAIAQNYRIIKSAIRNRPLYVIGIAHAPKGKLQLRKPNSPLWQRKEVKLIKVNKLISLDNPTLLGITYILPGRKGPALFGIEEAKGKLEPHIFPITPMRYGRFKRFLQDLDWEIKRILYEKYGLVNNKNKRKK